MLTTRQTDSLWIVCDEDRLLSEMQLEDKLDPPVVEILGDDEPEDTKPKLSAVDKRNQKVKAMFQWLQDRGRMAHISPDEITDTYIDLLLLSKSIVPPSDSISHPGSASSSGAIPPTADNEAPKLILIGATCPLI